MKHVKVAEEDLDCCETESVEMSTPVEEGHAVIDEVFKGDLEQYRDDETAVENSPREYDDILWHLKGSIRQSNRIGGVPMDIAADPEEGVPSELKKSIKQPGVPPSVCRCNVQEVNTIGLVEFTEATSVASGSDADETAMKGLHNVPESKMKVYNTSTPEVEADTTILSQ